MLTISYYHLAFLIFAIFYCDQVYRFRYFTLIGAIFWPITWLILKCFAKDIGD